MPSAGIFTPSHEHQVAGNQLCTGNCLFFSVPDHHNLRGRQVFECIECLVGFPFLDHVNADDADDKNQHDGAISRLSENKINDSGNHQQKEHRLTEGMKNGFEETVLLLRHQFIFAVLLLSLGDLIMGQPLSGSS